MNTIIENLVAQVDDDGLDVGILKEITSVRADPNVALRRGESAFTTTPSGI